MMPYKTLFLISLTICKPAAKADGSLTQTTAAMMGNARSGLFVKGTFSVYGNPALTAFEKQSSAGMSVSNFYMLKALQYQSLTAIYPFGQFAVSAACTFSGNTLWKQSYATVHTACAISESLSVALGASALSLYVPAYGKARGYAMSASFFCALSPQISMAFCGSGLFSGSAEKAFRQEKSGRWGLSYRHEKHLVFNTEFELTETDLNLIPSMQYKCDSTLSFVLGINLLRKETGCGLQFSHKQVCSMLSFLYHPHAGLSSGISIAYVFKD